MLDSPQNKMRAILFVYKDDTAMSYTDVYTRNKNGRPFNLGGHFYS